MTTSPERPEHFSKAHRGMTLIELDNLRSSSPVQVLNACSPIVSNELGNVRVPVNLEQFMKALSPIVVNELGNVRVPVNPEHSSKALLSIVTNVLGNVKGPVNPEHL